MTDHEREFEELMQRIRRQSSGAAQELFERYAPFLVHVIRRKMHKNLRSRFDSADFLQSLWASFFAEVTEKNLIDRPEAMKAYLAAMARNKVVEAVRQRLQTQKYDVTRERSLDDPAEWSPRQEPAVKQPTPSQLVMAEEEFARLQAGLPEHHRRALQMLREGYTQEETARALELNVRTVRRLIRMIAHRVAPQ